MIWLFNWLLLVCRWSINIGSGWEYLREGVQREEWQVKSGKLNCKRQNEEEFFKEQKVQLEREEKNGEYQGIEVKVVKFDKEGIFIVLNEIK